MTRPGRAWLIAGALLLVVGAAPVAVAMAAGAIADARGCRLEEGDVHPCLIFGHDWGALLYAMGEAFWLELITLWLVPASAVLLIIGIVRRFASRSA